MHHQEQNSLSLTLHTAAVELMRADEMLIQHALDILVGWDTRASVSSKPLTYEWVSRQSLRLAPWNVTQRTKTSKAVGRAALKDCYGHCNSQRRDGVLSR